MTQYADIARLQAEMESMAARVVRVEGEIQRLEDAEQSKWRWGVTALGSVIVALIGVIWQYRSTIFRG